MKKLLILTLLAAILPLTAFAQNMTMNITIDGQTMTATLVENSSTAALIERLQQGSVTYPAHDYGGFEKVGDLGLSLPQNNRQTTTSPGDIILYQGTSLCLYYAQNSWNFTPMGKINFPSESALRDFLKAGKGEIPSHFPCPKPLASPPLFLLKNLTRKLSASMALSPNPMRKGL